ncbi:MAG: cytochrome c [Planctomycetes bacterium]|nr:cytochrome c [Planctomycetota bacterium]
MNGSIGTEALPERVLQAFQATYPDLFPGEDWSAFGLITDTPTGLPVGVSVREVPHLGGLLSWGMNCAACHVGEVSLGKGDPPVRVLGMTGHLDIEAFFGSVAVAMLRTREAAHLHDFLRNYLLAGGTTENERTASGRGVANVASSPAEGAALRLFDEQWKRQEEPVSAALLADARTDSGDATTGFHELTPADLALDSKGLEGGVDFVRKARAMLRLFHNMRVALHLPEVLPESLPPRSGPGRNDPWGLLSLGFFNLPLRYAPMKFGPIWDADRRPWVHVDGNTSSPVHRNLAAALVLGAPLQGHRGHLDYTLLVRQTEIAEHIRPPRYPWPVDSAAAQRGRAHYVRHCAQCHDVSDAGDSRLHDPQEIATDPTRSEVFDAKQAELFNAFFDRLEIPGYRPPGFPTIRSTGKYVAADLSGAWARSPYLHNGSVRSLGDLLKSPASRPRSFHRGSKVFDPVAVGYVDEGPYVLDTTAAGNSNGGHDYGTGLTAGEKRELIEHLKSLY